MNNQGATERVQRLYDEAAGKYDNFIRVPEKVLFGDGRRWICSLACGDVLDIAVGTGRNLPYYPADPRVTGIGISPAMLSVARERAHKWGCEIDLRIGNAQAFDFRDERLDTFVFTLALSTIPDLRQAEAEGFQIEHLEHLKWGIVERPVARKPR